MGNVRSGILLQFFKKYVCPGSVNFIDRRGVFYTLQNERFGPSYCTIGALGVGGVVNS